MVKASQPVEKKKVAKSCHSAPENLNKDQCEKLQEESFQKWLQSKREEKLKKQEREKEEKAMMLEKERMKKEAAELSYLLWKHKKDELKKAKERQKLQLKEEEEQWKMLKKQVSTEKVNQWMKTSKWKPRPIPSNKGLFSLTATNPPSFYNPHAWVDPV